MAGTGRVARGEDMVEIPEQLNLTDAFLDVHLREGRGDRTALIVDREGREAERYSYQDVARHADRFAVAFKELGVEPEQRVLVSVPDGVDFVGALFGALKIGAAVVMVNPEVRPDEAAYFLRYTRAKVAVVAGASVSTFAQIEGQAPLLRALLLVGEEASGESSRGRRLADLAPEHPPQVACFETHRDDAAIWLFSGGTTGKPKAVLQTHGAFLNTTRLYGHGVLGLSPSDITLSVPKLFFGYATGSNLFFPFSVGATSVLFPERVTPERLFALIERHRPTVLIHVPTMVGKMLATEGAAARDLSSLRLATSAGEALPEPLFQGFKDTWGLELLDGLGTAEMWHVFLSNRPGSVRPGTLGQVVEGFEVRVCDDEGRELPQGETGWLWVKGDSRALGYFQQHARSCEVFRGPWYITGDMVSRDEAGTFTYCGRGDDMLKVSGKWLAPREVESCLCSHPGVLECAVVGVSDGRGLVKPCAFVRPSAAGEEGLEEALKAWVRERLEPYKAPRQVVFMAEFPRTHLGKIDRGKLRRDTAGAQGG